MDIQSLPTYGFRCIQVCRLLDLGKTWRITCAKRVMCALRTHSRTAREWSSSCGTRTWSTPSRSWTTRGSGRTRWALSTSLRRFFSLTCSRLRLEGRGVVHTGEGGPWRQRQAIGWQVEEQVVLAEKEGLADVQSGEAQLFEEPFPLLRNLICVKCTYWVGNCRSQILFFISGRWLFACSKN